MASYVPILKNSASGAVLYEFLSPSSSTGRMQSNPTLATGDVKISLDGGAFANLATLPVVTPTGSKAVRIVLSQAETNADNIVIIFSDQTDPPEWADLGLSYPTASKQFDDLPTASENATALLDLTAGVETGITLRQWLRLGGAVLFGPSSGLTTSTATYRDTNNTKDRVVATVSSGDRSAVTYDAS